MFTNDNSELALQLMSRDLLRTENNPAKIQLSVHSPIINIIYKSIIIGSDRRQSDCKVE